MNAPLDQLAEFIKNSRSVVAFTGAGISTESGIPDFRSPGGVWAKYQPVYFDEFCASAEARDRYWQQKCEAHIDFADAQPNRGHAVLAQWEQRGILRGVITQNIDGLHQMAGSKRVLELHGTARKVVCLSCQWMEDAGPLVEQYQRTGKVPACPQCRSDLRKHATVSFGQMLPEEVLEQAVKWCRQADLLLAMGSSLVVTPAADLPRIASHQGARVVIINRDPTPLDYLADLVLNAPIGETLDRIESRLEAGL